MGPPTVNGLPFCSVREGGTLIMKSTLWTPMGRIHKDLLKISGMNGIPYGLRTVNRLPSRLIGRVTGVNFEIYVMDADGANQRRLD